jgi:hypothetical protein
MLTEMPGKYINIEEERDKVQTEKKGKPTNQKAQIRDLGPQGKRGKRPKP